jgi:hypothetical protein
MHTLALDVPTLNTLFVWLAASQLVHSCIRCPKHLDLQGVLHQGMTLAMAGLT